jgi:hypothetical protein
VTRKIRLRTAVAAVAVAALPLTGCATEEPAATAPPVPPPPVVATPPDATEQPGVGEQGEGGAAQDALEDRVGQSVDVTGEVAEVISANSFTIGGDEIGENPILVVGKSVPAGLAAGETVRVSGTVTVFQVIGYERDLDLDLIDQEYEDFDNDPAIQASSVTRV